VHNLYDYVRSDIKANPLRIKEWDFYQITDERYTMQMTIGTLSYGGMSGVTLFDRQTGERFECNDLALLPFDKYHLPTNTEIPHTITIDKKNFYMSFDVTETKRRLTLRGQNRKGGDFKADIVYEVMPGLESLVMAVPFAQKGHFYLNQKINCMPVTGCVRIGRKVIEFKPDTAFGLLDWGRGVWTYKNTWYWGSASGLVDGERFGFNIGYGFGNTRAASENMLFYKGRAHKLSQVIFHIPGDGGRATPDYMRPWTFTSDDGRFEMDYTPVLDRASCSDVGLIKSDQHQVFGVFNGRAVLDDGTVLNVKDLPGFAEKVINKW
jgi:hypothetical protein